MHLQSLRSVHSPTGSVYKLSCDYRETTVTTAHALLINCLMQDFCWKALKEEIGCLNMYKFYGFYIVYLHAGPLLTECTNSLWMTDQRTRELALIQHQCGKYRSGPCITCSILCHICRPPTVSHTSQSALATPSVLGFMVWPSINVYYILYYANIPRLYWQRTRRSGTYLLNNSQILLDKTYVALKNESSQKLTPTLPSACSHCRLP